MHVIGPQLPGPICDRMYTKFATQAPERKGKKTAEQLLLEKDKRKDGSDNLMTFEDLVAFYLVMSERREDELGQLTFELIKRDSFAEKIGRKDLIFFCKDLAQLNEIYVNDFYRMTGLDPDDKIPRDVFLEHFPKVSHLRFLAFVGTLIEGYKPELLNFEDDSPSRELLGRLYDLVRR